MSNMRKARGRIAGYGVALAVVVALASSAAASGYTPGAWNGASTGRFAVGDVCYQTNPTCSASSRMDDTGAFSLDDGFALDTFASTNGGPPSHSMSVRKLLVQLPFRRADVCDAQGKQVVFPTITLALQGLAAHITSDGEGDERGSADLWLSVGSVFTGGTEPVLLTQAGTTANNWSKRVPLATLDTAGSWGAQGAQTVTWAQAGVDCYLIGAEADLDVTVVSTLDRGRRLATAGRHCVSPACVEPAAYTPSIHSDRLTVTGTVASVTTTFPRRR